MTVNSPEPQPGPYYELRMRIHKSITQAFKEAAEKAKKLDPSQDEKAQ